MGLFDGTSLEQPVTCESCGKELEGVDSCACPRDSSGQIVRAKDIRPRVRREKRRGKWATIVVDLASTGEGGSTDLKALLKELRGSLGTGGGIDENSLVIQGDHRDAIVRMLQEKGFDAKAAGG